MSDVAILGTQTRYALLTASRNPRVLVFGLVFPVILLVLFGSIFGGDGKPEKFAGGRIDTQSYFTAGMIAYAIALQGFTQLAISVTTLRETGQLKRLRGMLAAWGLGGLVFAARRFRWESQGDRG